MMTWYSSNIRSSYQYFLPRSGRVCEALLVNAVNGPGPRSTFAAAVWPVFVLIILCTTADILQQAGPALIEAPSIDYKYAPTADKKTAAAPAAPAIPSPTSPTPSTPPSQPQLPPPPSPPPPAASSSQQRQQPAAWVKLRPACPDAWWLARWLVRMRSVLNKWPHHANETVGRLLHKPELGTQATSVRIKQYRIAPSHLACLGRGLSWAGTGA